MTENELIIEFKKLNSLDTLEESNRLLDVYIEFFFNAIMDHHEKPVFKQMDADSKIILQMMMTKALHLKNTIAGISYITRDGSRLNPIIDPTIVASMVRNIYETVSMFHLIYVHTNTDDEKEILYLLWVHSGLMYRQKFDNALSAEENKEKYESEKKNLEEIVSIIENNNLFKSFDEKNRGKIRTKLKEKDFLIRFDGENVIFLHWHELIDIMGIKTGLLKNIYTYFSLYTHPSNVAVFQFSEMFNIGNEAFFELTKFNLKIATSMFSIFIADYLKVYPHVLKTFEKLPHVEQIIINFNNTLMRGHEYTINDSLKI